MVWGPILCANTTTVHFAVGEGMASRHLATGAISMANLFSVLTPPPFSTLSSCVASSQMRFTCAAVAKDSARLSLRETHCARSILTMASVHLDLTA